MQVWSSTVIAGETEKVLRVWNMLRMRGVRPTLEATELLRYLL